MGIGNGQWDQRGVRGHDLCTSSGRGNGEGDRGRQTKNGLGNSIVEFDQGTEAGN